ncbi:hypothetical protein WAI453_010974 [Rhynchosporium graminicola]
MTIDSKGIKSIHRSGCSAAVSQSPFNVYTTIGIKHNFIIKFQYGISRLALSPQSAELQITDLLNLNLRAIHAHTHTTPIADTTFAQIDPAVHRSICWFYVPNPPTDKINAFGVRISTKNGGELQLKRRSYLVRTPQRADFYIGPPPIGSGKTFAVHTPPQSTLFSSVADNNFTLIRGVLTEGGLCSAAVPSAPEAPLLSDACYSSAQLKEIMSIWIFRDEKDHFCRGLIIEYLDGTERALGLCRIGVDTAESCAAVERLSFKAAQRKGIISLATYQTSPIKTASTVVNYAEGFNQPDTPMIFQHRVPSSESGYGSDEHALINISDGFQVPQTAPVFPKG